MKLITQIFIDTNDNINETPSYAGLDLFQFEDVEITSSIQDVRDIGAVFTDYSPSFVVPASKNNNRVLKHFYNDSRQDGFDARIKRRGKVVINGVTFREGYIRLAEAEIRNNKPYSYTLVFFGSLVQLTDVIGDDKLIDLEGLAQFTHAYTEQNVYDGFIEGLAPSGGTMVKSTDRDVIYPAISAKNQWIYNTETPYVGTQTFRQGLTLNLYRDAANPNDNGINYLDLKPAIKVIRIIEAIEATYSSITFSRDFFNASFFDELYLLLHAVKGELAEDGDITSVVRFYLTGTNEQLGTPDTGTDVRPLTTIEQIEIEDTYDLNFTLTPANLTTPYTVKLYNGSELLRELVDVTGVQSFTRVLRSVEEKTWNNLFLEFESNTTISFTTGNIEVQIVETGTTGSAASGTFSNGSDVSTLEDVIIERHLPDIGVLSFLKGLFKAFNLTAELKDGVIVVKDLYSFYRDGNDLDWTDEIETESIVKKRSNLFDDISFRYEEPKTFGVINQNEVNNDEFGDLDFQATSNGKSASLIFDGLKYEVKLPFEKLFFPVMSDEFTGDLTTFGSGWLVDKDQEPTITKPVIFFNNVSTIDTATYQFEFKNKGLISTYNRPSSVSSDGVISLHFGEETDEFSRNTISNSLFEVFYRQYIEGLYAKDARLVNVKAKLPLRTLISYGMGDKIRYKGIDYRINSITTKLNTGQTDLELIRLGQVEQVLEFTQLEDGNGNLIEDGNGNEILV